MKQPVRVRFAPSPTGPLHIGGVRTALYNYLVAKKYNGKFILRIEDTDQKRFVPHAEAYSIETLQWLGIVPDEGPEQGGNYGPYKQSERNKYYHQHIERLIKQGDAYYAFDTPEELDAMRDRLKGAKVPTPQYNAASREWMRNSLTMPQEEVEAQIKKGTPYVIRLKVPHKQVIRFHDEVRGWIKVDSTVLDDKILMKSDGIPTYHFANVVDDYLMGISHVIRGEEWLPSTPMHLLLYQCLGWEKAIPIFVHLPLLLGPSGSGKLSKRDTEKYGFPIFPIAWKSSDINTPGFREKGYLPSALINFLALLGWNPGNAQELFTKETLIKTFSIEKIGKSGVKFDIQKAAWFNQNYLKKLPDREQASYLLADLARQKMDCTLERAIAICQLVKERVHFPHDFWKESSFFFQLPTHYNKEVLQKKCNQSTKEVLQLFLNELSVIENFEQEGAVKAILLSITAQKEIKIGQIMPIIRIALTGKTAGADLMKIMVIMGREESVKRLMYFFKFV